MTSLNRRYIFLNSTRLAFKKALKETGNLFIPFLAQRKMWSDWLSLSPSLGKGKMISLDAFLGKRNTNIVCRFCGFALISQLHLHMSVFGEQKMEERGKVANERKGGTVSKTLKYGGGTLKYGVRGRGKACCSQKV